MSELLLFKNTRAVIKADTTLTTRNIQHIIKPVPKNISSECGMCIQTSQGAEASALLLSAEIFHERYTGVPHE